MHSGSPPPQQPPAQPPNQIGAMLPILVGGLALLLIAGVIAGAMLISASLEDDPGPLAVATTGSSRSPSAPASASPSPDESPSPSPSIEESPTPASDPLHDSCLIGTWRETSHDADTTIGGVRMRLHSWGAVQNFRANGGLTVDYGRANNARAKVGPTTYEVISSGTLSYNWQTSRGQILYSNAKANGTTVFRRSGREVSREPLSGSLEPERYTCSGDSMREFGPTWTIELRRVNSAGV